MTRETVRIIEGVLKVKSKRYLICIIMMLAIVTSCLVDVLQILWICRNYSLEFSDIIHVNDFAAGGVYNVDAYPGYLIVAGIRFHLVIVKLVLGILLAFLLRDHFKIQDVAVDLYTSLMKKGEPDNAPS
jgi:hypothetical protein